VSNAAPANRQQAGAQVASRAGYHELKSRMHRKLIDVLDLSVLNTMSRPELEREVTKIINDLINQEGINLNRRERETFVKEVLDELLGFGPLEPLLDDPDVNDILVNGPKQVYVERRGKLYLTNVQFKDDGHLAQVIDRIVSGVGRHIDEAQPMCDCRLPDGSRVNAVIPPVAVDGPSLSIRKFRKDVLGIQALIDFGALSPMMSAVLQACVKSRLNILISGGTGSGKTTLLNCLSAFVPHDERIVTCEEAVELQLQQPHVVRLETRPPNLEGRGEVTMGNLVKNCLRMRPERIIVGECRGGEALDMLQAMNTGHEGSMTTLHANSPRDAIGRLETMIAMAGMDLPARAMRVQIASAIDMIVQAARLNDGSRKIINITEVLDMEGDIITMQDIFIYERKGMDPTTGKVIGQHKPTGVQPRFMERLKSYGQQLPEDCFKL